MNSGLKLASIPSLFKNPRAMAIAFTVLLMLSGPMATISTLFPSLTLLAMAPATVEGLLFAATLSVIVPTKIGSFFPAPQTNHKFLYHGDQGLSTKCPFQGRNNVNYVYLGEH